MEKEQIQKEIDRLDKLAERAYYNYQDTGDRKYMRTYEKYSDQADVYRIAINAHDEHMELIHIRANVSQIVEKCRGLSYLSEFERNERYKQAVKDLLAILG